MQPIAQRRGVTMNNPVLISESFERAAYAHKHAMESFRVDGFEQAVRTFQQTVEDFQRSVDKFQTLLGMQSENMQREACGESPAYRESDFADL
jgi:predicted outer membrane protein